MNSQFVKSSRTIIIISSSRLTVHLSLMARGFVSRTKGRRDLVTSGSPCPNHTSDLHVNWSRTQHVIQITIQKSLKENLDTPSVYQAVHITGPFSSSMNKNLKSSVKMTIVSQLIFQFKIQSLRFLSFFVQRREKLFDI